MLSLLKCKPIVPLTLTPSFLADAILLFLNISLLPCVADVLAYPVISLSQMLFSDFGNKP